MIPAVPPPDPDEAREWLERELSDPVYREAEATVFDRVARAIAEFFEAIFNPRVDGAAWSGVWTVILVLLAAALIVTAFVIWGRPRLEHRRAGASSEIFDDDARSADELRADAERAAGEADWDAAVVLRFRALARGLDERGVLRAPPGTTARALARAAAPFFPDSAPGLDAGSSAFDDVRYLRRAATADVYAEVAAVDDAVRSARPALAPEAAFA